jgi:hypothetical protein
MHGDLVAPVRLSGLPSYMDPLSLDNQPHWPSFCALNTPGPLPLRR